MTSNSVAIIDYGLCNLHSVVNACKYVGLNPIVTSDDSRIIACDGAILPGVGAFGQAIKKIRGRSLDKVIFEFIESGKPFMGICLGLQLLFEESEEFGKFKGLGVLPGKVRRLPSSYGKVPLIGWRKVNLSPNFRDNKNYFNELENQYMYFVHSYYVDPISQIDVLTYSNIDDFRYCTSVARNNIFGFQFHPEKSGNAGLLIYLKFKKLIFENNKWIN